MNSGYLIDTIKSSKIYLIVFGVVAIIATGMILFVVSNNSDNQPTTTANAVTHRGACDDDDWDKFVRGGGGFLGWGSKDPCAIEVRYGAEYQPLDFILVYTGQDAFEPPDGPYFNDLSIPSTPYIFQSTGVHEGRQVDYFIYYENEEDFNNKTNGQMVISSTKDSSSKPVILARTPVNQSFGVLSGFDQCVAEGRSLLPWAQQCLSYEDRGLGESPMANIDWVSINRQTDHEQAELAWQRAQEQEIAERRARAQQQAAHDQEETEWQQGRERDIADRRAAVARGQEETQRLERERQSQASNAATSDEQTTTEEAADKAACDSTFLGIPAWYNGLAADGDCTISPNSNAENGLSSFIWRIALNLVEAILRIVGYATVGFIIYGGYKYMISAGSPDGMTAARKTILNAVIGLVISIAAVAIVRTVSLGVGLG